MLLPSHAIKLLTSLLTLVIVFHVLILIGIIPHSIASKDNMIAIVMVILNIFPSFFG